jgi:transposase
VKILTWDKGGFVLVYKRLERGQFKLPHMDPSSMTVEIDSTQLTMLLDGIDFGRVRRPDHWKPPSQLDRQGGRPMDKPASP